MASLRTALLAALSFALLVPCFAQQPVDNTDIYTISVAAPTKAKDLQLRYFLGGEAGGYGSSVAKPTDDNKIVIKTGIEGKSAKSLKLIAYAPGCQFVTITVDDLASSNRQGTFECNKLDTVEFFGKADVSALAGKALDVQVLYACDWAAQFFAQGATAVSPFSLGKAQIASDGSFVVDLPDFSADPLWSSLTSNARLTFFAVDASSGHPIAALRTIDESSTGGWIKVAAGYPHVQFVSQSN